MVCYVDLLGLMLNDFKVKILYFKKLGLIYFYLMLLYDVFKGDSDGGYVVLDYCKVNLLLGLMEDFELLFKVLCEVGINLVLDFVFNYMFDEYCWVEVVLVGDKMY